MAIQVQAVGYIAQELKIKTVKGNRIVLNNRINCPRDIRDKNGNIIYDNLNFEVWGQNALNMLKIVGQYDKVLVSGDLISSVYKTKILKDNQGVLEEVERNITRYTLIVKKWDLLKKYKESDNPGVIKQTVQSQLTEEKASTLEVAEPVEDEPNGSLEERYERLKNQSDDLFHDF